MSEMIAVSKEVLLKLRQDNEKLLQRITKIEKKLKAQEN
jgi:BMFP domain-containing protein YqiC